MPALIGQVPWDTQTQFPQFTPEAYRRIFQNSPVFSGANADHLYDVIVQEAQAVGLAPSFLAAIIAHETGAGRGYNPTTGAAEPILTYNNPGGLMAGSRHLDFDTIEEGLRSTAQNSANNWIRAGQAGGYNIPAFREIYAPSRAPNDPNNLNRFWVGGVEHYLGRIGDAGIGWASPEQLNWNIQPSGDAGVPYTGQTADPSNWHGDTGQPIGPRTGIPESPGITLTGPSLEQWMATQGQEVSRFSHDAGYDLPTNALEFVGRVAPELGGGPEAFPEGNFPWFTPGRIGEAEGAVLQYHALMPNNLVFNPESQIWDVPQERRFPGATGIWGAQRVADWLPTSGSGFEHDYLTHLGYGAPPAGNLFAGNPYGNIGTLGMGNQGFGNIADMSTYGHQPFDYTQWFGALGTGGGQPAGNPGNLASGFDMSLYNQTAGIGGGTPSGSPYNTNNLLGNVDLSAYYRGGNPSLPPPGTYSGPGYPGSAILPPPGTYTFDPGAEGAGLGYEGSYGLTNLPDTGLANAIGASQLQDYYANMNNIYSLGSVAAHGGPVVYGSPNVNPTVPAYNYPTAINQTPIQTFGGISIYSNPNVGGPNIINYG